MNRIDSAIDVASSTLGPGGLVAVLAVYALIVVASLAGLWRAFEKANRPGWKALVPVYNFVQTCRIVGRPGWWVLLMLVPLVNVILGVQISVDLAHAFDRSTGFGVGLLLLPMIFYPLLGFRRDVAYAGPVAA